MADVKWVKVRSWHAVSFPIFMNRHVTHCGRLVEGHPVTALPAEKSCETCLRIVARLQDA